MRLDAEVPARPSPKRLPRLKDMPWRNLFRSRALVLVNIEYSPRPAGCVSEFAPTAWLRPRTQTRLQWPAFLSVGSSCSHPVLAAWRCRASGCFIRSVLVADAALPPWGISARPTVVSRTSSPASLYMLLSPACPSRPAPGHSSGLNWCIFFDVVLWSKNAKPLVFTHLRLFWKHIFSLQVRSETAWFPLLENVCETATPCSRERTSLCVLLACAGYTGELGNYILVTLLQ